MTDAVNPLFEKCVEIFARNFFHNFFEIGRFDIGKFVTVQINIDGFPKRFFADGFASKDE